LICRPSGRARSKRCGILATLTIPTDTGGFQQLLDWATSFGKVLAFEVEGTGSYGGTLASFLRRAARAVLAGFATATPKTADGEAEMIRWLKIAHDQAVEQRAAAMVTMKAMLVHDQGEGSLLIHLKRMLPGWCAYCRPGVSSATFQYLSSYTWSQVMKWLRRKHRRITWKNLRRRYCGGGWWPVGEERTLFNPGKVRTTRYRYRGAAIPSPWPTTA